MKRMVAVMALLFSVAMFAQEVEKNPKLEKDGDMVKATYFHNNGEVAQTGYYLDGKLHGEWKSYDESGKKTAMAEYDRGNKTGKWFFWDGDVLKEVNYDNNKIASVTTWSNASPVVVVE